MVLVAIVIFFLVLVTPSELLHLCYYVVRNDNAPSFELALVLANVLQTANFALNFLLYCACNSQFRDTWKHLLNISRTVEPHVNVQRDSRPPGVRYGSGRSLQGVIWKHLFCSTSSSSTSSESPHRGMMLDELTTTISRAYYDYDYDYN